MVCFEGLDRRAHLSVSTVVNAGGLPRQLTAVGDTVYFAVDNKADGHLSYVDLTAYNVKTKTRTSIRRADGTKFGQVEYTLASVDNRLRITELLGKGKTAVWSLKEGENRAKPYSAPKSPVSKALATGYNATATPWTNRTAFFSGRSVYTLNASTGKTYAVNVPFEKHLDHIAGISAVGNKLIVDAIHTEGEKLYVVDRTTGVAGRFRPSKDAGDANLVRVLPAGAIVQARISSAYGGYGLFLTDGTLAGTKRLPGFDTRILASAEFLQSDAHTIYFSDHAASLDPTDPERAGPYVAPTSSYDGDTISFVGAAAGDTDTGIFKLDLEANTLTAVAFPPAYYHAPASDLTLVGGSLYYDIGNETTPDTGVVPPRQLYRLDLTSNRYDELGAAFEGPVFADGEPIYTPSATAMTLTIG